MQCSLYTALHVTDEYRTQNEVITFERPFCVFVFIVIEDNKNLIVFINKHRR